MSQIYLFTGENTWLLREEKHRWYDQFTAKHGGENLLTLEGKGLTFRLLLDEISSAPFIASKRLVVVEGIPKFTKEEVESLPVHIHPDCLLLFSDAKPDKRLGGTEALLQVAEVKEFKPLTPKAIRSWMQQLVKEQGSSLQPDAGDLLCAIVGEDQDMLAHEVRKVTLYAGSRPITKADIDLLAVPSGEQEVWHLSNLIAQGKSEDALRYVRGLLQRGEDPFSLWAILLWMLRSLVSVAAAVSEGQKNPAKIASMLSVPFPTARTFLPLAERLDLAQLRSLLDWAVGTDIELKTGGYKVTSDAQEELLALIDEFLLRCRSLMPLRSS